MRLERLHLLKPVRRTVALLAAGLAAQCLAAAAAEADEAIVAVAANFREAMETLEADFEQRTGHELTIVVGATGRLYAQIVHGAPYDVFLAADAARPARLEAEGRAIAGSRFTYALGRLALWSADPDRIGDDAAAALRAGAGRIAIADPDLAPYGAAAMETIDALDLREALQPRLVTGASVGQAHALVASGAAELGFVAAPGSATTAGSRWIVPERLHAPIRQDAVLLARAADNAAARDFLAYLDSEAARAAIARLGYGLE